MFAHVTNNGEIRFHIIKFSFLLKKNKIKFNKKNKINSNQNEITFNFS